MTRRPPAPWMFLILPLPYAIISSGISGTLLDVLLRRQGVSIERTASEVAFLSVPSLLFFLWSPLSDFWLRRRSWHLISAILASIAVFSALRLENYAGFLPESLLFLGVSLVLLSNACNGGLIAALMPPDQKVRVASFLQIGNLGGGALGGGVLVTVANHTRHNTLALAAAICILLPSLLTLWIEEPAVVRHAETLASQIRMMALEFKSTFLVWAALPALLLLIAPMGSGGAIGVLASVATDYGLTGDQVAWINGYGGALLTGLGALVMMFLPSRIDTRIAYPVAGVVNALCLSAMLVGHPRPATYLAGVSLYLFSIGACWALYSALVLQVVGVGGRSGSSRYAISVSLANLPVVYMAKLDGMGAGLFGPKGLPATDLVLSVVSGCGFLLYFWWRRRVGLPEVGLVREVEAA